MKAKERLYLTLDQKRVVTGGRDAAFLLAGAGCEIRKEHEALVEEFYSKQAKAKAKAEQPKEPEKADPIESRQTRVPKGLSKRGSGT